MSISMFAKLPIVFLPALLLCSVCGSDPKDNGGVPDPDQPGTVASDDGSVYHPANGGSFFSTTQSPSIASRNMSPYTITLNPAESYQVMEASVRRSRVLPVIIYLRCRPATVPDCFKKHSIRFRGWVTVI